MSISHKAKCMISIHECLYIDNYMGDGMMKGRRAPAPPMASGTSFRTIGASTSTEAPRPSK